MDIFPNELMMTSNLWFREELCVLLFLWRNKKTMKGGGEEHPACVCECQKILGGDFRDIFLVVFQINL